MSESLTDKQRLFVAEYLVDLNATQAAIRAGYSEKTARSIGYELLGKPHVQAAITEAMNARAERTELTQDFVLNGIRDVVARCMQGTPVLDSEGTPTGEWKFEASAALKGYELLGKHLKMFGATVEHKITDGLAEAMEKARRRVIENERSSAPPNTLN